VESLKTRVRNPKTAIYEIPGGKFRRFVVSTPQTRKICNVPEITGQEFRDLLRTAVINTLKNLPDDVPFAGYDDRNVSVFHFLRGGLNFDLIQSLYQAYGFNRISSSFMTSQRYRKKDGWAIKMDQYRQFSVPQESHLFIGDVVATGTTIENGLEIIRQKALEQKSRIRSLTLFTIGGPRAEEILESQYRQFKKDFQVEDFYLFYFEGRFALAEADTPLTIAIPGTDLLRHQSLLTPEFELSQYEKITYPLERCVIYDVGAKSFEALAHLKEVKEYWEQLKDTGLTLYAALKERWPQEEYEDFDTLVKAKRKIWPDLPKYFLEKLHKDHQTSWSEKFIKTSKQDDSLKKLCEQRIKKLESLL